jgi:hypothetical protein
LNGRGGLLDDFIIVGHIPLVVPIDRFPAKYTPPKVITMMSPEIHIIHKFNLNNAFAKERMRKRRCAIILLLRCGDI